MRTIGLDWGEVRVGAAVTDPLGFTAQPLKPIKNNKQLIDNIRELVKKYSAKEIVIGDPLKLSGGTGESHEKVKEFSENLERELNIKITLWDERLSTKMAERSLIDSGMRRENRKGVIDSFSASLILQSYMSANKK